MHKLFIFGLIAVACIFIGQAFAQEAITVTTYYPSPYGVYRELRSQRQAIGDNYIQGDQYCWKGPPDCTNDIDDNADLVVEGNVGIGTTVPTTGFSLDVNGAVVTRGNSFYVLNPASPAGDQTWGMVVAGNNGRLTMGRSTDIPTVGALQAADLVILQNGNVGIGKTGPGAKLDVDGNIRLGNSGSSCSSSRQGEMRYNSSSDRMQYCNGSSWKSMVSECRVCIRLTSNSDIDGEKECSDYSSDGVEKDTDISGWAEAQEGEYGGGKYSAKAWIECR